MHTDQWPYHYHAVIQEQHVFYCVCIARKSAQTSVRKISNFSLLVGNAIKMLKQAGKMKHKLSSCILIPIL